MHGETELHRTLHLRSNKHNGGLFWACLRERFQLRSHVRLREWQKWDPVTRGDLQWEVLRDPGPSPRVPRCAPAPVVGAGRPADAAPVTAHSQPHASSVSRWSSRKVRDLWWQGIPPSVRGKVWSLAIGNELNITHELFDICLARAKERWRSFSAGGPEAESEDAGFPAADREASLELIKLDISRTFPNLCIFQQGGPYHDTLHSILGAYTCYRPDVGYVQGMSFIAAVLILNLDTADAFIAFSNLLNKPCQMAFFRVDHGLMLTYFAAFEVFFEENLPKLFAHFKKNNLTPDIYLIDWIFTLYSKSLPLDLACRVWDVFCRDGEEFLFRTALGLLKLFEDILTKMDFIHVAQFLTRLPDHLPAEELFASIATIQMQSRNRKWAQVLTALQRDSRDVERGSPSLRH
ncbi:TBC1 domain family member 14-like [Phyllostomus discolor]|uniref:TBC1 domain family member 14-like n=1 Tax=Phyllostomus discolor TaxID=89673 RepID=A0A7E6CT35_9CHIR|nr:TBC1 domain family member 14-like [Phyllostomus discolor]